MDWYGLVACSDDAGMDRLARTQTTHESCTVSDYVYHPEAIESITDDEWMDDDEWVRRSSNALRKWMDENPYEDEEQT